VPPFGSATLAVRAGDAYRSARPCGVIDDGALDAAHRKHGTYSSPHGRRAGLNQEELAARARLSLRGVSDLARGASSAIPKRVARRRTSRAQLVAGRFHACGRPSSPGQ
jgi:hypothetical protein